MSRFPVEEVIDLSKVNLRIGASPGSPLAYLQFYFTDASGIERRYTLRVTVDQMQTIAKTYEGMQEEIDLFEFLESDFER